MWRFNLAKECFEKAGDLSALMLLLVAMGDRDGLKVLAGKAGIYSFFVPGFVSGCADELFFLTGRGERPE